MEKTQKHICSDKSTFFSEAYFEYIFLSPKYSNDFLHNNVYVIKYGDWKAMVNSVMFNITINISPK